MFNDKHFSYSMEDGLWMWNRAKELDMPLFAGSSLVVCYRRPFLEHPKVRPPKPRTGFADFCSCHCSSSSSCCFWAADLSPAVGQGAPIEDALIISGGGPDASAAGGAAGAGGLPCPKARGPRSRIWCPRRPLTASKFNFWAF